MFKQRVVTAAILAPLALAAVFLLPLLPYSILMGLLVLTGAWEWSNLALYRRRQRALYVAGVSVVLLATSLFRESVETPVLMLSLGFWLFALFRVRAYPKTDGIDSTASKLLIGLFVLLPAWIAMVGLKAHEAGTLLILLLFLLVWGADIGAYFSGKRFGRTKLIPQVSPGKTREGVYGGLAACALVGLGFSISLQLDAMATLSLLFLGVVIGAVSVLGDLLESMFKRERGIKDSGAILPGHGGILDRIDSLTAAAPIFLVGVNLLPIF